MSNVSGLLVLALLVGFLAIAAVSWNAIFGAAHENLMPPNNSTYYPIAKTTDITTMTIGTLLPWALIVVAALGFVTLVIKMLGGIQ